MAEEPPAEGARHRPALDFQAGYGAFHISIKIDNPWLAAGLGAGILTLGAFYISNRESVEAAVKIALADLPGRILNITPSSILVRFVCDTEEKFLAFMKAFATGTLKQRLQKEFSKIGFKYKLEVTITVYDPESEMRTEKEEITSTFGRPVIVDDSSGVESVKSEDRPPRQLRLRKFKKLQPSGSRPAYPKSRKEKEKTTTPSESGYSGVESIESEDMSCSQSSPTPLLQLSSELKKLQPFGSRPAYPKSRKEKEGKTLDFELPSVDWLKLYLAVDVATTTGYNIGSEMRKEEEGRTSGFEASYHSGSSGVKSMESGCITSSCIFPLKDAVLSVLHSGINV